jgi:hypothetical protein
MPYLHVHVPVPDWKQTASLARALLPFIGGLLVMRGVVNATQWDSLVNQITTVISDITVLIGLATPIVSAVWGMISHSDATVVKQASQVPGVHVNVTDQAPDPVKNAVQS